MQVHRQSEGVAQHGRQRQRAAPAIARAMRPVEAAQQPSAQLAHALHHCSCWPSAQHPRQWQRLQGPAPGGGGKGSHLPPLLVCSAGRLPSQAESLFNPTDTAESLLSRVPVAEAPTRSVSDLDYLTELLAIQQSDGPKNIGFFGTRNMGVTHQKLVEILSYAYASTGNHIYTSGSIGTNAAVIKGALRANCPDKLTVILPQSLKRQPAESQDLLKQVGNLVEMPENDDMSLLEASRICNQKIINRVQQVICFAFHDSRLLLETCHHAKDLRKIVTLFYLD